METNQIEKLNIETNEWDPLDVVEKTIGTLKERTIQKLKDAQFKDPYGISLQEAGSEYFKLVPRKHNSSKCQNQKELKQK